ncbi:MAG: DUF411 domain-containing protein [Gemmatimonadaceae bacterium]|jgi:hypothetical protein|nr:DUF411 domain-containing protein [Gemmatimonadaceae bacterium]
MSISRRAFVVRCAALACVPAATARVLAAAPPASRRMTVYKDAGCGCCKAWIAHLERAGFTVTSRDVPDINEIKQSLGVPDAMASCHTGVIGSVLIEGHVPADVIAKFVDQQADPTQRVAKWKGLAVPGMPQGSPGMEGPNPQRYDVLSFGAGGATAVYATRMGTRA